MLRASSFPVLDTLGGQRDQRQLSLLQLEGVAFAYQKHQFLLPGGARCGFFIGDSAGTGKGAEA
jgi:hypothetical protein